MGKKEESAISGVIKELDRQRRSAQSWPVVKVIPGMKMLLDVDQHQRQPFRIVPFEEQIVRTIPGGEEERKELSQRMAAFDDFMFLLD